MTESTCETAASTEPSRGIRAIYSDDAVRVYQAYNDAIAESAVAANSFQGPLGEGKWSSTRMTWIKPSKVWMAYRCGFTLLKDKNQSRVLALDLSRQRFEELLTNAAVHGDDSKKKQYRNSSVVVQWDPERYMTVQEDDPNQRAQGFTVSNRSVRSIQIGLRGAGVEALLDPKLVLKITDVTQDFRNALAALQAGDLEMAKDALWPTHEKEQLMEVPQYLRQLLRMDLEAKEDKL
ncbi:expressed unknown protein [Seminavis robusta]|uniref:DUF4291 domain-containing protein n=1 Tax=Seminavis robusta TaxID=568900 RepID=A0A9N8F2G2_9STRA|nr:expressed unknown protein [Seminavis robusta]|eukprot:Sro3814_g351250.1 n/a (235) ;mRNA; r:1950-2654